MAITGTGAQTDPWIVHNYDEIKDVLQNKLGSNTYAKLANDIDCNDYGDAWEWKTITVRANWNFEFDLDGHTIKNIMIKSGNSLFYGKSTVNVIRNGKILNVFNNSGASVIDGSGLTLKNISMSVNGTGLTSYVFKNVDIKNSALYLKSNKLNADIFGGITEYGRIPFENTDIYLDINNPNGKMFISSGYQPGISNCRICGKFGSFADNPESIPSYIFYKLSNCIVELEITGDINSQRSLTDIPSTGIYNNDKLLNISNALTPCTTAQMRDADYLNSIGFTVVKVGE